MMKNKQEKEQKTKRVNNAVESLRNDIQEKIHYSSLKRIGIFLNKIKKIFNK